ncbi:MAG: hypothetical protein RLZZ97_402 [Gemmatimonadota bacterium]|jgi:hypothetical protein
MYRVDDGSMNRRPASRGGEHGVGSVPRTRPRIGVACGGGALKLDRDSLDEVLEISASGSAPSAIRYATDPWAYRLSLY